LADEHGTNPSAYVQFYSDVFRSVEVRSRPMQKPERGCVKVKTLT